MEDAVGAIFGDSNGNEGINRVTLPSFTQSQVMETVRKYDTPEKLAGGLLFCDELATSNCTKPIRSDIKQLDGNRLWAIKCKYKH